MNPSITPSTSSNAALTSLETSLNKIFLAVGDFLEFNSRTSSLGLESYSRKPHDEARRALDESLQTFHSSCDALEIQIIRAKRVLRREIQLLSHPVATEEPEKPEEIVEPEPEPQEESMQEVNGVINGDVGEVKIEGEEMKEEEMDEEGLFSSEFDNLMDPSVYQTDMAFGEDMDWIVDDM